MGIGYADDYVKGMCFGLNFLDVLRNCIDRIRNNTPEALNAMGRWFGDTSAPFKSELLRDLNKFRNICNMQSVVIGFENLAARDSTTNASAWPGSIPSFIPGAVTQAVPVTMDLAFGSLPKYLPLAAGVIDASAYSQSKLETALHELSHAILGTKDKSLLNGHTAYGAQQAAQLAIERPDRAKKNAENWGIFIEALGYHNTH